MGALSQFVHTSQLPMIQVSSETDIDKKSEGEVLCLMIVLVHNIL